MTTKNMSTNSPDGQHGIDIFLDKIHCFKLPFKAKMGFPGGSEVNNPPSVKETWVRFLGQEDSLEKEVATYSSILTWEIP